MKFVSTIARMHPVRPVFRLRPEEHRRVDLHFFLGYELRGPLVLMLLAFFIAGAFLGILAVTPTVFRHRRESSQHKNTIQALQSAAGTAAPPRNRTASHPQLITSNKNKNHMEFEIWWLLGIPVFFALGWIAARVDIKQLVSESRSLPRGYFKGLNFLLNEQPDKAIDAFIEIVKLDPGNGRHALRAR
jgi:hypothetical protein